MYNKNKFLAIIPARGGSKRLPNKNLLELNGKPLICWSIEAGLKLNIDVVVNSDNDKILHIAKQYEDINIIKRPIELATDTATTIDVIKHTLTLKEYKNYEYIILLQPTSPLRTDRHIMEAIELLDKKQADAIISVTEMEHSPLWTNTLPSNLDMSRFLRDEIKNKRSQDLPQYYRINGAIYICKIEKLLEENTFFLKNNIFAYIMDRKDSVDIDSEIDFKLAEFFMNYKKGK